MSSGRKRFLADLDDLKALSKKTWEHDGVLIKGFRAGDEEGAIEFRLVYEDDPIASVNLLISDTTAYPKSHTCFAFAQDDDVHETVVNILENQSTLPARPLKETVTRLVHSLAAGLGFIDDEEDDDMEYIGHDEDDHDAQVQITQPADQLRALKSDFLEVVSAGYRPALMRLGSDIVVIISQPVIKFKAPATALAAWDARLISPDLHLTLIISGFRGAYPALNEQGSVTNPFTKLKFNVGLSIGKPSKEAVDEVTRDFGLKEEEVYEPEEPPVIPEYDEDDPSTWQIPLPSEMEEIPEPPDPGRFERFSLSTSLNSLLNDHFQQILQFRLKYGIGWAGAEILHNEKTARQVSDEEVLHSYHHAILQADAEERTLDLPVDPLASSQRIQGNIVNLPLLAYSYLARRFLLCPRFCLVCHQRLPSDIFNLKPYVCGKDLCSFQFYAHERGTSIEYEVLHNGAVVDLLVSLACCSAMEGQMSSGLPTGIGLRVPAPEKSIPDSVNRSAWGAQVSPQVVPSGGKWTADAEGFVDFDSLTLQEQRWSISELLNKLPKVSEMRKWLTKKTPGNKALGKKVLRDMDKEIPSAAWTVLRWCIASCTSYIEEISSSAERLDGVGPGYYQFRFSVGSPQQETKFRNAVDAAKLADKNAKKYPTIYAWHGSLLKNWHSIIRQGLNYDVVANGRAYGNGVYFGKDGTTSLGYSRSGANRWRNSELNPSIVLAIVELVNLPHKFVSNNPHYVVADTSWIATRYLLVSSGAKQRVIEEGTSPALSTDPSISFTLANSKVTIPARASHLEARVARYQKAYKDPEYDEEDLMVFNHEDAPQELPVVKPANDWVHDPDWTAPKDYHLLPPPTQASPSARQALQKELNQIIRDQERAKSLRELGIYLDTEHMGDNLFQWMVEMHSFDPALPIAKDMAKHKVNSILFEIRFPPSFPHAPPFLRVIKPRLLPFQQGGGGHVTAGGSVCMDLLVSDGWLPSYSIAAVMLQVRMAISSTIPNPARLAQNWQYPYGVQEALDGFTRAAATHGWTVPPGTRQLVLR